MESFSMPNLGIPPLPEQTAPSQSPRAEYQASPESGGAVSEFDLGVFLDSLGEPSPLFTLEQAKELDTEDTPQIQSETKTQSEIDGTLSMDLEYSPKDVKKKPATQKFKSAKEIEEKVKNIKTDSGLAELRRSDVAVSEEDLLAPFDPVDRKFFKALARVESSGGKNRIHENAGTSRAMGSFGLVPTQSPKDIVANAKSGNFATAYPEAFRDLETAVKNKNWVEVGKITLNPNYEAELAKDYRKINRQYLRRFFKTNVKDPSHKLPIEVLAWNLGAGGAKNIYKKGGIKAVKSHPYVKKFLETMED